METCSWTSFLGTFFNIFSCRIVKLTSLHIRMNAISYVNHGHAMNRSKIMICRLDSIGLAGFSHDFGSLRGQTSALGSLLDSTSRMPMSLLELAVILLEPTLPFLTEIPTPRSRLRHEIKTVCGELSRGLLTQTKRSEGTEVDPKSILGLLSWCYFPQSICC
jgi:hypothetical protein